MLSIRDLTYHVHDDGGDKDILKNVNLDVEDGRSHLICAYVSPKFFKRYLRSKRVETTRISVYVEFYVDGIRVAREERHSSKMPNNWYNNQDKMQSFPNSLLPKSKTPFAAMDFDYYEFEKTN